MELYRKLSENFCEECVYEEVCTSRNDGTCCLLEHKQGVQLVEHELTDEEFDNGIYPCQLCDFGHCLSCPSELCTELGFYNYFTVKINEEENEKSMA